MNAPDPTWATARCRALQRSERAEIDGRLRTGRMCGHALLSRLLGGRRGLEWMLAGALSPAAVRSGFAVPLPYALRGFGERLRIELPTAALDLRLADWVQCGHKVVHVGDYFLGLCAWESIVLPFSRTGVMREATELSRCDLDYRATPSYRHYRRSIEEGRPIRRNKVFLSSEALLDAYFERYLSLYRSIREHGVLPLRRAREVEAGLSVESAVRRQGAEANERDIGVAIGPEGRIYCLPGGKHRLAIAKVLGIERVPVEVRMVHGEWIRGVRRRHGGGVFDAVRCGVGEVEVEVGCAG